MDRIAIFARYPVAGEVKTRLSPAVPSTLALALYTGMLNDALACAYETGVGSTTLFWASEPPRQGAFLVPPGIAVRQQQGADMGDRLSAAFAQLLSSPDDRAVVIGADCPDLSPKTILGAFASLDRHEIVLGPARDGGYYLIGLRRPAPSLFGGVSWGTGTVLTQTLERADRAGLAVDLLEVLEDIDTPEDLVHFLARRSVSTFEPGARTEAALRAMGLLPPRS